MQRPHIEHGAGARARAHAHAHTCTRTHARLHLHLGPRHTFGHFKAWHPVHPGRAGGATPLHDALLASCIIGIGTHTTCLPACLAAVLLGASGKGSCRLSPAGGAAGEARPAGGVAGRAGVPGGPSDGLLNAYGVRHLFVGPTYLCVIGKWYLEQAQRDAASGCAAALLWGRVPTGAHAPTRTPSWALQRNAPPV